MNRVWLVQDQRALRGGGGGEGLLIASAESSAGRMGKEQFSFRGSPCGGAAASARPRLYRKWLMGLMAKHAAE